jgi:Fe2+ or Zn2+ uptake regulation protein
MQPTVISGLRTELRRAGLPDHGVLARLLGLLRASPDTHLSLGDVIHLATASGLRTTPVKLTRCLETLADLGLLGRFATTGGERVFDTVPESHSHLFYEETAQTVDLHVSGETLLAILRQALDDQPDRIEILVRFRGDPEPGAPAGRIPKAANKTTPPQS